jgi:hypothetical protein
VNTIKRCDQIWVCAIVFMTRLVQIATSQNAGKALRLLETIVLPGVLKKGKNRPVISAACSLRCSADAPSCAFQHVCSKGVQSRSNDMRSRRKL